MEEPYLAEDSSRNENEFSLPRPFNVLVHDENGILVGDTIIDLPYEKADDWDWIKKMVFAKNPRWEDRCGRIDGFFIDKKDQVAH